VAVREGHHRGQIVLEARQMGAPLPAEVTSGLWQWKQRAAESQGALRPNAPRVALSEVAAMPENKTKPTDASVEDYIASRADERQRADCRELMALLERVTRQSPRMWGPSIVGYGSYRYTYESGRTGEAPLAGFAIRGRELVVYLDVEGDRQKSLLSRLGRHRMGKVCLYFRRMADLDPAVLEQLVTQSVAAVRRRHG
jgi:hypothetical protein